MPEEVHHLVFETRAQLEAARTHALVPSIDVELLPSAALNSLAEAVSATSHANVLAQLTVNTGQPAQLYTTQAPLPDAEGLNLVVVSVTTVIDHQLVTRTEASLVQRSTQETSDSTDHV